MVDVSFSIEQSEIAGIVVLTVAGEIDLYTAPRLRDALAGVEARRRAIVVLGETTFIESTGLGILVEAARRLRSGGGVLSIVCGSPHVRSVIELTGIARVISVYESVADALAAEAGCTAGCAPAKETLGKR